MNFRTISLTVVASAFAVACGGDDPSPVVVVDSGASQPDTSVAVDSGAPDTSAAVTPDASADAIAPPDAAADASPVPDAAPPAYDPAALKSLVLWLDASKGVTQANNKVSKWLDQTSNHNDASQGTLARQPALGANVINALPALHFDKGNNQGGGNGLQIADGPSLQWSTGDFFIAIVARFDNKPADGLSLGTGPFFIKAGNNQGAAVAFYANIPQFQNQQQTVLLGLEGLVRGAQQNGQTVTVGTAYNTATAHIFVVERVGNSINLRVDGAQVSTAVTSGQNIDAVGANAFIGADGNFGSRLNGDIAEVMATKATLAVADRTGLEGYLKARYATP